MSTRVNIAKDLGDIPQPPSGYRVILACLPEERDAWRATAAAMEVEVHVVGQPVPRHEAFWWFAAIPGNMRQQEEIRP